MVVHAKPKSASAVEFLNALIPPSFILIHQAPLSEPCKSLNVCTTPRCHWLYTRSSKTPPRHLEPAPQHAPLPQHDITAQSPAFASRPLIFHSFQLIADKRCIDYFTQLIIEMQEPTRKLVKRRPASRSQSRERPSSAGRQAGTTPAVTPWENTDTVPSVPPVPAMPSNGQSAADKEKKSKWRLSNPFHNKEKERHSTTESAVDSARERDSAYDSGSRTDGSRTDVNSSGIPSFSSTENRISRPVSGEQQRPAPQTVQAQHPPTPGVIPPTPPTLGQHAPPPRHDPNAPPLPTSHGQHAPSQLQPQHSHPALTTQRSQENLSRETYQDSKTGNVVTITTTTTTTTITTTGPGGTTTVQAGNDPNGGPNSQPHITNRSGPSPPSPAPTMSHTQHPQHPPQQYDYNANNTHNSYNPDNANHAHLSHPPQAPNRANDHSPPIPHKSNMRDRVELPVDARSPQVEQANPLETPISPNSPTRANFSYPSRIPPAGVPRHVPSQQFAPQSATQIPQESAQHPALRDPTPAQHPALRDSTPAQHPALRDPTPAQYSAPPPVEQEDHFNPHQTHHAEPFGGYPAPLRPGHQPEQGQGRQKGTTLANLKIAAAGIHVSIVHLTIPILTDICRVSVKPSEGP